MFKKFTFIYKTAFMAWFLCLLAGIFYAYDFLLRIQPNILVNQLMHFYGTNAAGIGVLYAAYYWAYTPLQIPAGLIIDRYNTCFVLTLSAVLCALGALLFAAGHHFIVALVARMLMGFGSAFAFIGALKLAARWLPQQHFAAFSGLATTLGTIGALGTNVLLPIWISHFGWQDTILLTGYIGIGIAFLIALVIQSKPLHQNPSSLSTRVFKNWKHTLHHLWSIAKKWQFWINGIIGCLTFLPITVLAGLWGTSFLKQAYHMSSEHAATADAIIFIGMSIGGPIAGWVSDHINRRKIPLYFGSLFSALILFGLIYEPHIPEYILYGMLFFLGFFTGPQILVFAIGKEISPPRTTGTSSAFTNFLVTMGALVFAPLIGYLMVVLWDGKLSMKGIPIYSLHTFREALLILPISLLIAMLLLLFIPETYCKAQYIKKSHLEH